MLSYCTELKSTLNRPSGHQTAPSGEEKSRMNLLRVELGKWFPLSPFKDGGHDDPTTVRKKLLHIVEAVTNWRDEDRLAKLQALLGDTISEDLLREARVMYTLSKNGDQFRAWYGPMSQWHPSGHPESSGKNILFSVSLTRKVGGLRIEGYDEWLEPFVGGLVEFTNPEFGTVWVGKKPS